MAKRRSRAYQASAGYLNLGPATSAILREGTEQL